MIRTETLTLPWPPSANNSKTIARGRMISTEALRNYHTTAGWTIRVRRIKPLSPPYEVTLEFCPPDYRRRDIANLEKAVCDSMTKAGLITDDSKIDKLTLIRRPKIKGGCVIVTVRGNDDILSKRKGRE